MGTKIADYIEEKEKEFNEAFQDIISWKQLADRYPDLEIQRGRLSSEFFVSKSVNSKVTDAWFGFGCGCCENSPFYAYPYLHDKNGTKIYADPFRICIGEKCPLRGLRMDYGWEDRLRGHGLPESIIDKTRVYIDENTWDYESEWDDEDEDDDE